MTSAQLTEWQEFFKLEQSENENARTRAELANELKR